MTKLRTAHWAYSTPMTELKTAYWAYSTTMTQLEIVHWAYSTRARTFKTKDFLILTVRKRE
jgi:hypothetical protein